MYRSLTLAAFVAVVLVVSTWADENEEWIRLGQQMGPAELCPLQIEIPIDQIVSDQKKLQKGLSLYRCDETYISLLKLHRRSSKRESFLALHVQSHVFLAPGYDRIVYLKYSVSQGGEVLARGRETLDADEGELNWDDGALLRFTKAELGDGSQPLLLRVQMSVD